MKKIKWSLLLIISLLLFVGCTKETPAPKEENTKTKKEIELSDKYEKGNTKTENKIKYYDKYEEDYIKIGELYAVSVNSLIHNDLVSLSRNAYELEETVTDSLKKIEKESSSDFSEVFISLLSDYSFMAKQFESQYFEAFGDTPTNIRTKNKAIADNYYDGKLPPEFIKMMEATDKIAEEKARVYKLDEWWEVEGQWRLKINSVTTTNDRNHLSDKKPVQVIILNYTYENIGYENYKKELHLVPIIIDSNEIMADNYPLRTNRQPKETPIGATAEGVESAFGLANESGPIKILFEERDTENINQTATFAVEVK